MQSTMMNVQLTTAAILRHGASVHGAARVRTLQPDGAVSGATFAEVGRRSAQLAHALRACGVAGDDRVATLMWNNQEHVEAYCAVPSMGAVLHTLNPRLSAEQLAYIGNHAEDRVVIVDGSLAPLLAPVLPQIAGVHTVVVTGEVDPAPLRHDGVSVVGYEDFIAGHPETFDWPEIDELSASAMCYTSGTTGNPKGVILSHGNLASNVTAVHEMLPLETDDRSLSFLPWAHSFGQTVELHVLLSMGGSMALAEAVDKIIPNLAETTPTFLVSVPRIFNRIYDGVNKQMTQKPGVIRGLFYGGLKAATKRRKGEPLTLGDKIKLSLADKLVFGKIRAKFGGRLKYAFSGGAALSKDVAEFIDGLGITVYEGYGLTETSPIATANRPGHHRIGSVGKAIPGCKVVIDKSAAGDDKQGEIVLYGPNIMQGYHNRDEENAAVFTEDRGFRTGDLGYLDDEGFLYITGRIKEQYKLENGKYVAPAPLEEQLKLSPYILNAMIYGDNRLYNVALIVPDIEAIKEWGAGKGLSFADADAVLASADAKKLLEAEIEKYSDTFKGFEKIKRFTLTAEDFTTQNGMLTPSLKLKRRVAWAKYGPQVEALYAGDKGKGAAADATA